MILILFAYFILVLKNSIPTFYLICTKLKRNMDIYAARRVCKKCKTTFQSLTELSKHKKLLHKSSKYMKSKTCELCGKSFLRKSYLQKHHNVEHTTNPVEKECDQCEKTFPNEYKLAIHVRSSHHRERKFSCQYCHQKFITDRLKEEHVNRKHLKIKNVSCTECDYEGYSIVDLRCHKTNKHSELKPYKCTLCPMAFPRVCGLYSHQETHENAQKTVKDNPCQICGKMFKSKKGSVRCAKIHKSEGNFQCSFEGCDAQFTNLVKYKWHNKRFHSGVPLKSDTIPCHDCDKAFRSKTDLKRHVFYMHERREKAVPCAECPKVFVSAERLKRHILIHSGAKFKCPFEGCGVERKLQYYLNAHFNEKHGKVKHRKSMVERMAKATEKVPCTLCKKMIRKKCVKIHMKAHSNQDVVECFIPDCSEIIRSGKNSQKHRYNLPSELYDHLQKMHNFNLKTHTVCVRFKCKHCCETLQTESIRPLENEKFWNTRNAKNWSTVLNTHITKNHEIAKEKLNLKNDWESHYEKGTVSIKERNADKEELIELQKIMNTLECKLCSFVPSGSLVEIQRRSLLGHYCLEHFRAPLTDLAEKDLNDTFCKKCNKKFDLQYVSKRLMHVGYNHRGLYPYLKTNSNIDLSPFIQKQEIAKVQQKFSCNDCGKVFNQKGYLKAHMVYHNDERPFPCELCVKAFKTLRDLDVHKRSHNGEKPFSCETCDATFSQDANLWSHMKRYHCDGSFSCKDCKNIFTSGWALKTHRASVCTLKPFPCDKCGKGYEGKANLKIHQKSHD